MNKPHWYRQPFYCLLAFELAVILVFEIAPLFTPVIKSLHSNLYMNLMADINFNNACLGGALLYFCLLPHSRRETLTVFAVGLGLEIWLGMQRLNYMIPSGLFFTIGAGWLFVALLAIVCHLVSFRTLAPDIRQSYLEIVALMIAMPIAYPCNTLIDTNWINDQVYDPMLLVADGVFGCQPSFLITRIMRSCTFLRTVNYCAYFELALFMLLAQLVVYKRQNQESNLQPQPFVHPVWLYLIVSVLGVSSYRFYPAIGTQAFCGTALFPYGDIPAITALPHPVSAPLDLPRDATPSLHLTWILCAFFSVCRLQRSYKFIGATIAVLVWLSAFSVGHHWLTDFIVALPFTAMCLALASFGCPWKRRRTALCLSLPCYAFLMWLLKYQIAWVIDFPTLYLALAIAICALSWWLCLSLLPPAVSPGESPSSPESPSTPES